MYPLIFYIFVKTNTHTFYISNPSNHQFFDKCIYCLFVVGPVVAVGVVVITAFAVYTGLNNE